MDFLEEGAVAAFRNSGQFDEAWYVQQYPDVKLTGIDPAKHYLWLGARLGRRPSPEGEVGTIPAAITRDRGSSNGHSGSTAKRPTGVRAAIQKFQNASDSRTALRVLTPELRGQIHASGLFDEDYYREQYVGRITDEDDLLADYVSSFRQDLSRDPGRLFSTRFYVDTHADVKDMHPFVHYIQYGMAEGRAAFCPDKVNAFLASGGDVKLDSFFDIVAKDRPINVLYWGEGNFFFTDVALFLEQLLNEQGYRATACTDLPKGKSGDALNIVVAPHEFCAIGPGRDWTAEQYADAIYVSTEQWQTSWFALSLKYLKLSRRGILDLNPSSAQGLVKIGLKTAFLPLLPLPGSCFDFSAKKPLSPHVTRLKFIDPLTYPAKLEDRAYDVLCCGVLNDRRAKTLSRMAPVLAAHRCFIHMPRFNRPIKPGEPDVLSAEDFAQISRNSKIMLNIHQGETHYLEWQRAFLVGMMQGAVVVSEPCYPNNYVQPNVHYVEATLETMAAVVTDLLSTAEGRRRMSEIHKNVMKLRDAIANGERLLA